MLNQSLQQWKIGYGWVGRSKNGPKNLIFYYLLELACQELPNHYYFQFWLIRMNSGRSQIFSFVMLQLRVKVSPIVGSHELKEFVRVFKPKTCRVELSLGRRTYRFCYNDSSLGFKLAAVGLLKQALPPSGLTPPLFC